MADRATGLCALLLLAAPGAATAAAAQTAVPAPPIEGVETRVAEKLTEHFERVRSRPEDGDAWGRYGMVLDAHRMTTEAVVVYEEAWRLAPEDFRWPYHAGSILEYERPEKAILWFERAIELDGAYAPAQIRAAQTLEVLGRDDDARQRYRRAFDLDSDNALASLGLGRLALAAGDVPAAVEHLERAYGLAPDIQAVVATLARAYNQAGRRDEARAKVVEARGLPRMTHHADDRRAQVREEAVDSESFLRRARIYVDVGEPQRARAELESLVELEPELATAHFALAGVYDRLGLADRALGSAQKALELDPELAGSQAVVASALFKLGRAEEARAEARAVLREEPENDHMLVILSLVAAQSGDVEELLRQLERAFEARSGESPMRLMMMAMLADLAESFGDVGRNDEASEWMAKAVVVADEVGDEAAAAAFRARLDRFRAD